MARNKKFYLKDARDNLQQAQNMLDTGDTMPDLQTLRAAAKQAQEAAANLQMLVGVLDSEIPSAERAPTKQQGSGTGRIKYKVS